MTQQIKAKLFTALDKIGNSNGHAAPASQDPVVPSLHEYYVATHGEAYFKKRRENAKKCFDAILNDQQKKRLEKIIAETKTSEVGDSCTLVETDPYVLSVDVKNGASFLDVSLLKVTLMREHKMNATQVEALIEKCTDRRDPSQSWKVVER